MSDIQRSVELDVTKDEFKSFARLIYRYHLRRFWFKSNLILAIWLTALFATQLPDVKWSFGLTSGQVLCVTLALIAFLWPILNYLIFIPIAVDKEYKYRKDLKSTCSMSWSEDGIKTTSDRGSWITYWSDYIGWMDNKKVTVFFMSPNMRTVIPKRIFSNETQLNDFRQCLVNVLGNRQGLRP